MSVNHPRSSDATWRIKTALEGLAYYGGLEYKGHQWSATDQAWHVVASPLLAPTGTTTELYVCENFKTVKWKNPEMRDKLRELVKANAESDHRARIVNNTPGELVKAVKLHIDGREKVHEFNLGPGPCGRTVRALKFLDKGPTLEIHQFCEDATRADVFTYRVDKLVHWTIYRP